ncbi:hypothetical protein N624_2346 [Levilactobacillus brevis]|nr:hypothetical protein N624_2346 [Levilactobacillus brevis]
MSKAPIVPARLSQSQLGVTRRKGVRSGKSAPIVTIRRTVTGACDRLLR